MYEADGLGSVRGLLDASGAKTDTYSYEAFGSTLSSTGSDANPYRFAGERLIDSVGFYQNRARWLDTKSGRFVSVDPERGAIGRPLSLHHYLYASADPLNRLDRSGRSDLGETMATVMIQTQIFVLRNAASLAVIGGMGAALLPGDINDALMSIPELNFVAETGQAEARAIKLIKNSLTEEFIKRQFGLTREGIGQISYEAGHAFEDWAQRNLFPYAERGVKIATDSGRAVADFVWKSGGEEFVIELKTGAFNPEQFQIYKEYLQKGASEGRRLAYIFLEEPSQAVIKEIQEVGGIVCTLF
jgi:RHS repeat-associated protein